MGQALHGRELMALLIRPGASAAEILAQLYEVGSAADQGRNFDFGGRGYRVTRDTLREAMQIYNEHFPEEGMGQRVRRRFRDMTGASFQQGAGWAAMECRRHEWVLEQQAQDSTAWGKEPPTLAQQQQPETIRQRWWASRELHLQHRARGP